MRPLSWTRRAKSDEVRFVGSLSEPDIGIRLPVCDRVSDSLLVRQVRIDSKWDDTIGPTKLSAHNHCRLGIGLWILNLLFDRFHFAHRAENNIAFKNCLTVDGSIRDFFQAKCRA